MTRGNAAFYSTPSKFRFRLINCRTAAVEPARNQVLRTSCCPEWELAPMLHRQLSGLLLAAGLVATTCAADGQQLAELASNSLADVTPVKQFVESHCIECHDKDTKTAGLALDDFSAADIGRNNELWEKVVRKLTTRQMPPPESMRPEERDYDAA